MTTGVTQAVGITAAQASSGGSVSSLNALTGALNLTSSGATIIITPAGSNINLEADVSAPTFNLIGAGTNTTAAMVVGTGASIAASGSGTITATAVSVGGISGLGSGVGAFLATPSSVNLASAVTDETGSGALVFGTAPTLSNPVVGTQSTSDNSTKAASTAYVTTAIANAVAGVNPAVAVQAATTQASDTSGLTYNNGVSGIGATLTGVANTALTIDGYTFTAIGQRLLVKNDTQSPSGAFNGMYYVTQIQTALLPIILTRALDYDTPSDINNTGAIPVINGTAANMDTSWIITSTVNTVGTDPLTYTQFTKNPATLLTTTLTSAHILVGNGSNVASDVAMSGDITITNAGVTAIGAIKVTNAMLAGSIDLTAKVTGILPAANGGSGNGFFAVSGPAASTKTFTLPNASSNILTDNAAVTAAQGGTGQTTYAQGDFLYASAANTLSKLAAGTSGQILQTGGTGGAPSWVGKELALLGSATASASTTLDFANLMSSAYDNYLLVVTDLKQSGTANFLLRVGTGATPTYQTTNYGWLQEAWTWGTATNTLTSSGSDTSFQLTTTGGANDIWQGQLWFMSANSSTDGKPFTSFLTNKVQSLARRNSGEWLTNTVVTALRFLTSANNFTSGKVTLYGVSNT